MFSAEHASSTGQGRNYHEASEAVASSLKSRSSDLNLTTHLLFHKLSMAAAGELANFDLCN